MNPNNPRDLQKLNQAISFGRRKLEPFRKRKYEIVQQLVGNRYGDHGSTKAVPINLIELATNIFTRQLAANAPRALVSTAHMELKPMAMNLELAMNHLIEEIDLGRTLRLSVIDSLFSMGIIKVGLNRTGSVEINGVKHDVGQPFADTVTLDDWVHDPAAKLMERCQFMGNRYRVPLDVAREMPSFNKKARDELQATPRTGHNEAGDEREETHSQGHATDPDEYKQYVELWDIWLPQEGLVVTIPVDGDRPRPLRVVEWDGPEHGPYHILSFSPVPGNTYPLPPAAMWFDLHDLANRLWNKLGRQAGRQKTILGVMGGAEGDAKRVIEANDGETIRMDNPDRVNEFKFGGIDPSNLAFALQVMDKASYLWGNLDALGGLSPQAETLGQDQMLIQNASKRVADMQDRTIEYARNIMRDLGWYMWQDPLIELPLVKRVPGTDVEIPVTWTPEQREGDFMDYNLNIEPYSMQHSSPGLRLQTLMGMVQSILLPAMPMLEQQGIHVDFEALLKLIAKFSNLPELEEILVFSGEPSYDPGPVQTRRGGMPAQTTRRYERVNRPGATRSGKEAALMQTLLGGRAQPSEMASIGRPIG